MTLKSFFETMLIGLMIILMTLVLMYSGMI